MGYLLGGLLFGLILEYVNVVSNMGYSYGKFVVMFGKAPKDIPLCIGVGWGIIMYAARMFSDNLKLPLWSAAALDTLFAISIDISMDVVAYRLHMWHWNWSDSGLNPLTADWFGIPYGNFFGWLMVVFFYSSISRLLERAFARAKKGQRVLIALVPILSVLLSQVFLYVMLVYVDAFLHRQFGIISMHRCVAFLLILIAVTYWGVRKVKPRQSHVPAVSWLVPLWFHTFFFAWLFIGGFYKENKWLIILGLLNLVVGAAIHTIGSRKTKAIQTL